MHHSILLRLGWLVSGKVGLAALGWKQQSWSGTLLEPKRVPSHQARCVDLQILHDEPRSKRKAAFCSGQNPKSRFHAGCATLAAFFISKCRLQFSSYGVVLRDSDFGFSKIQIQPARSPARRRTISRAHARCRGRDRGLREPRRARSRLAAVR